MSLNITPEIEASMRATKAEMDAAMRDPSFRAEVEEMKLRYKARELIDALSPANASAAAISHAPNFMNLFMSFPFVCVFGFICVCFFGFVLL